MTQSDYEKYVMVARRKAVAESDQKFQEESLKKFLKCNLYGISLLNSVTKNLKKWMLLDPFFKEVPFLERFIKMLSSFYGKLDFPNVCGRWKFRQDVFFQQATLKFLFGTSEPFSRGEMVENDQRYPKKLCLLSL